MTAEDDETAALLLAWRRRLEKEVSVLAHDGGSQWRYPAFTFEYDGRSFGLFEDGGLIGLVDWARPSKYRYLHVDQLDLPLEALLALLKR